jgi:hypothetical protein
MALVCFVVTVIFGMLYNKLIKGTTEKEAYDRGAGQQWKCHRFPERFCFQLTRDEFDEIASTYSVATDPESQIATLSTGALRSQSATLKSRQGEHRKYLPYAYTEQGIGMLSGMLKNDTAVQVSIGIMDAFVEMRRFVSANRDVLAKLVNIDTRLLEHDRKFDEVFDLLQRPEAVKQCILDDSEVYAIGASLKDVGKKCFEVSRNEDTERLVTYVQRTIA